MPSPLLDALYHGRYDEADRLLAERGEDALSIHEAAALGSVARLERLLATDASLVNAFSDDGFQPLPLAAFFGREDAARLLLEHGGEVNTRSRNAQGVSALHAALAGPMPDIARSLIAAGADVNLTQQSGVTPLHEAAHIGRADLVRLFLDHGADPSARDERGRNAADFARASGHASVLEVLA